MKSVKKALIALVLLSSSTNAFGSFFKSPSATVEVTVNNTTDVNSILSGIATIAALSGNKYLANKRIGGWKADLAKALAAGSLWATLNSFKGKPLTANIIIKPLLTFIAARIAQSDMIKNILFNIDYVKDILIDREEQPANPNPLENNLIDAERGGVFGKTARTIISYAALNALAHKLNLYNSDLGNMF